VSVLCRTVGRAASLLERSAGRTRCRLHLAQQPHSADLLPAAAAPVQEIGILKSISYDRNIVQFYGACLKSATSEPMLLLEYCEGGDVRYVSSGRRTEAAR